MHGTAIEKLRFGNARQRDRFGGLAGSVFFLCEMGAQFSDAVKDGSPMGAANIAEAFLTDTDATAVGRGWRDRVVGFGRWG
ncbi:hypothetical protein K458DRAFT_98740 [Lentithecium fluviatile CBS 122367]|uniref:Uncharacterized protein n=1 Tax=Lentithecium fluviatile CBS 122367 TaxID=1168545 RepID=A0A6G1JIQ6_9PLEO|nr:hypothetical protein K458DRAFT_98740 [Lentithecium fluviatile CBS 122367]